MAIIMIIKRVILSKDEITSVDNRIALYLDSCAKNNEVKPKYKEIVTRAITEKGKKMVNYFLNVNH